MKDKEYLRYFRWDFGDEDPDIWVTKGKMEKLLRGGDNEADPDAYEWHKNWGTPLNILYDQDETYGLKEITEAEAFELIL